MHAYLLDHQSEFRAFTTEEALTLLLVYMKSGVSFAFLEGLVNLKRDERVNVNTIALTIKKVIYILVGENPNQKTFHEDMEMDREKAEKVRYHNSPSFNRIKKNLPGKFFNQNMGWKTIGDDLSYLLKEGASSFHKCSEMDFYELEDLVEDDDSGKDLI